MLIQDLTYNKTVVKRQTYHLVFILLLVILASNGFSYANWSPLGGQLLSFIILMLMFICVLSKINQKKNFSSIVLFLIIIPFISAINSYFIYNQSFIDSFRAFLKLALVWILYYQLHLFKVKEITILNAFICICFFILTVQVVQQFTYPNAIFGVMREEDLENNFLFEIAEKRNGLWRFRVGMGMYYTAPIIFLLIMRVQKKFNVLLFVLFIFLLASVYLTLTRQVIFAMLLTIFISFFLNKKNFSFVYIILGIALLCGLYYFYNDLFSDFIDQTKDEAGKDNIRIIAANYFWNDSLKSIFPFLFGHGVPGSNGEFYRFNQMLMSNGIIVADVGFIGIIWRFGLVYVSISYYIYYCIFIRFGKQIPNYIKLFAIYTLIMSIMIFPFGAQVYLTMAWGIILYICDLHINKSSLALNFE